MKVVCFLSPKHLAKSVSALVMVPAGEVADFDGMVRLIEHDGGHFGARVELVKVGNGAPEVRKAPLHPDGHYELRDQNGGFPCAKVTRKHARYYKIWIARD